MNSWLLKRRAVLTDSRITVIQVAAASGVPWELGWATRLHIAGIPEQGVWRESTDPGCWPWVKMTRGGRRSPEEGKGK